MFIVMLYIQIDNSLIIPIQCFFFGCIILHNKLKNKVCRVVGSINYYINIAYNHRCCHHNRYYYKSCHPY